MPEKVQSQQKTKELKAFAAQVLTLDHIKKSDKLLKLLYTINTMGEVSERGLAHLISLLKEKNIDLGYAIVNLGGKTIVRGLTDDVKCLLYVGLIEVSPKDKKLRLTSKGKEFLEGLGGPSESLEEFVKAVEELKDRIAPIEAEVSVSVSLKRK